MTRTTVAASRLRTALVVSVGVSAFGWLGGMHAAAQQSEGSDAAPSVWDGVYSTEQAERGQKVYEATCSRCHGEDLTGGRARPLVGESFIRDWGGLTLDSVLTRAKTMPPGASGTLGEESYLDILAYVLSRNEFPTGDGELTASTVGDILVYGEDGPDAVPNFAMVQVVGCLARGPESDWIVTDGSEPIRTREPAASQGDALLLTEAMPLGDNTFELMYVFPDPEGYEGHRIEAKGFLIRREDNGQTDAINVTTVASLSPACEP